jgi:hypothetical protein
MTNSLAGTAGQQMDKLIAALDSLVDGDQAVEILIASGPLAVPHLSAFLLKGSPRTISLPRCRAARALGELGACSTLISYFREYRPPQDAAVLFAEDAVRSAVAGELVRWKSDEVFLVLLDAARQRTTGAVVLGLGEFCRSESVPLLFEVLEDDLCRDEAMNGLRKLPDAARQFGILSIRGLTGVTMDGPSARCRRRATLQLLFALGVTPGDWPDLRRFLWEGDPGTVVAAAQLGFMIAPETQHPEIITALLRVAERLDFVQEEDVNRLLDAHSGIARDVAQQLERHREHADHKSNWLSPTYRILHRVLETKKDRQTSDTPADVQMGSEAQHSAREN